MATLVLVAMAIRVVFSAEIRTHGQACLERSCQSPEVQDETVAGLGSEVVR